MLFSVLCIMSVTAEDGEAYFVPTSLHQSTHPPFCHLPCGLSLFLNIWWCSVAIG